MPKFSTLIHGCNFLLPTEGSPQKHGFYVCTFVEAASVADAQAAALSLVRANPKLRATVQNPPDDPPRLEFEEVEQLAEWPADCVRPLSGFSFYVESAPSTRTA